MPLKKISPFNDLRMGGDPATNPYVTKILNPELSKHLSFGKTLKNRISTFQTPVIEIGCHLGNTLCEAAERCPDKFWIGLDITFKRVVVTAEKIAKKKLTNAHVIYANADALDMLFPENSLEGAIIFFPDPWPKKKHAHNRLVNQEFVKKLFSCLKSDAAVWFKTDSESYFIEATQHFRDVGLIPSGGENFFDKMKQEKDFQTTFQRRFAVFYEMIWIKGVIHDPTFRRY